MTSEEDSGDQLDQTQPHDSKDTTSPEFATTAAHTERAESQGLLIAGKYRLLEQVGEGGMGSVWKAEQRSPVKRFVAVKLIKAGMDSKAEVRQVCGNVGRAQEDLGRSSLVTCVAEQPLGCADAFVALNKYEDALSAYDAAIGFASDIAGAEIAMARNLALAQSGQHHQAGEEVQSQLSEEPSKTSNYVWFDSAKVWMAAAANAKNDEDLTQETRDTVIGDYHDKAIAALQQAADLGYFEDEQSLASFDAPEFSALQSRDDFEELKMTLEQKLNR